VKALRNYWRKILLVGLLAFGALGFYAYRRVHALLNPVIPQAMVKVAIPADVHKVGDAILKVYENELVPSGDKDPVITSVSPTKGTPGTLVTVKGSGFGDSQGFNGVAVNLTEAVPKAEVTKWTDTEIQFTVPEHATSGDVTVMRWDYIRTEKMPNRYYRPVAKNPRPSNGIPFTVLGQEERVKLGQAIFYGWTQQNEDVSSEVRIPRAKIAVDTEKWKKYGFLPRSEVAVDEGDADRFSRPTLVVGVRMIKGLDGEYRVGYSCAFCHTGRDPATGKITPGLPSNDLQFGKLIGMASNLPEDMHKQCMRWPAGTSDLSFRYFPDGIENPTAIMLARGMHGLRFWSSGGLAMPEYQRHSNAWLMQGAPYMGPLKISIALCCYLSALKPIKNPNVDRVRAERGSKVFEAQKCHLCHSPALGYYTNQRVFPFDAMGSNGPPTKRMTETGGIRTAPLLSIYATGQYLHDQSCATLDDLVNPARLVPGSPIYKKPFTKHPPHPWVVQNDNDRRDLVEFLKSL